MITSRRVVVVSVLLLILTACPAQDEGGDQAEPSATPGGAGELTIQMTQKNSSGQSGTATLRSQGERTRVVVELTNSPAGPQPIHIHPGTCATLNPTPSHSLTTMVNGKSDTVVDISLASLLAGQFAINVHKSPQEGQIYFSCGEIRA